MGQNIKDFKSWKSLNEEQSFLGYLGSLATSAFTGDPIATSSAPSSSSTATGTASSSNSTVNNIIKTAAKAVGLPVNDDKPENAKEKSPSKFKKIGSGISEENIAALEAAMDRHGITNEFARKAILGVISKEGPNLQPEEDYSSTPNGRIREIYGERVAGLSDDELTDLKNSPTDFWDRVYGPDDPTGRGIRYGNTEPGDGAKYRGRGFNQITFKSTYKKLQELFDKIGKLKSSSKIDIVSDPSLLEDPDIAAEFAVLYFINSFNSRGKNLNDYDSLESAVKDYVQANAGWGSDITTGHRARGYEKALTFAQNLA